MRITAVRIDANRNPYIEVDLPGGVNLTNPVLLCYPLLSCRPKPFLKHFINDDLNSNVTNNNWGENLYPFQYYSFSHLSSQAWRLSIRGNNDQVLFNFPFSFDAAPNSVHIIAHSNLTRFDLEYPLSENYILHLGLNSTALSSHSQRLALE